MPMATLARNLIVKDKLKGTKDDLASLFPAVLDIVTLSRKRDMYPV